MPRIQAYIIGHGSWSPKDGYTRVPAGCTVAFYTEFAKTLGGTDSDHIVAGTFNRPASRIVNEYMMVPNMKYFPMDESDIQDAEDRKQPGAVLIATTKEDGRDLKGLFAANQTVRDVDYHWAACLAIQFKRDTYDSSAHVGNVATGMNLTEMADGFYDYEYDNNRYVLVFRK